MIFTVSAVIFLATEESETCAVGIRNRKDYQVMIVSKYCSELQTDVSVVNWYFIMQKGHRNPIKRFGAHVSATDWLVYRSLRTTFVTVNRP